MAKAREIRISHGTIILAIAIVGILFFGGFLSLNVAQDKESEDDQENNPPVDSNMVDVTKPIKFMVIDPLGCDAMTAVDLYIYDASGVLKEKVDYSWTSAMPYKSGAKLYVEAVGTGFVTRWFSVTVPQMTSSDAETSTTNFMEIPVYDKGAYSIKVTDQLGNSYNNYDTLSFSSLGVTSVTLTVMIYNTEDNSGYTKSYDPLNEVNLGIGMVTNSTGSDLIVQGAGKTMSRGSQTFWAYDLNADALTKQVVGSNYIKSGITTMTITIKEGSLTGSQSIMFALMSAFDVNYFMTNGIGGPDAAEETSFTLTFSA